MRQLYRERGADVGPVVPMIKLTGEEQIKLDTAEETWTKDGWNLCPLSSLIVRIMMILESSLCF